MSERKLPKLSDANYQIMRIVWAQGETTVPMVLEILNRDRKDPLKRSSVQVQMTRLEEYGWLTHREADRTYYFSATVPQESTQRSIIFDLKERVFAGSAARLMQCLLSEKAPSQQELDEIKEMIRRHQEEKEK